MRFLSKVTVIATLLLSLFVPAFAQDSVYLATIKEQVNQGLITQAQGDQQIKSAEKKLRQATASSNLITFEILRSDKSLQDLLTRWGKENGWSVISKKTTPIKINGETEISRIDFITAAEFVITQSRAMGHKLKGEAFANKVLVLDEEKAQ